MSIKDIKTNHIYASVLKKSIWDSWKNNNDKHNYLSSAHHDAVGSACGCHEQCLSSDVAVMRSCAISAPRLINQTRCLIVENLPNVSYKPAVLATLGWTSMKSYIAYRKIIILWSNLCLHDTNIYKVITLSSRLVCATEETYAYKDHPYLICMRNYLMESITSKCIEELDCMTAYNQYPIRVYITGPSWRKSILTCVSMLRIDVLLSVVLIDSPDGYTYSPMSQFQISHVRNRTLIY